MTVTTGGAITVGAGDFKTTHNGVQIAVKVRSDMGVILIAELKPAGWESVSDLFWFNQDDKGTAAQELEKAGGAVPFVKNVLVPLINGFLAGRFKAGTVVTPPPTDAYNQIDAALFGLRWVPGADGTIKVMA